MVISLNSIAFSSAKFNVTVLSFCPDKKSTKSESSESLIFSEMSLGIADSARGSAINLRICSASYREPMPLKSGPAGFTKPSGVTPDMLWHFVQLSTVFSENIFLPRTNGPSAFIDEKSRSISFTESISRGGNSCHSFSNISNPCGLAHFCKYTATSSNK